MKRPLDRGLLAAVKRELAFIIPVSATKLACEVTIGPRSEKSKYTDARAHVRWRTAEGRVLEVNLVGSDSGDDDPSNIALAYLLGRAEKVKTGAGTPVTSDAKTAAKTGNETAVKTVKKTVKKTAKKTAKKTPEKTAKKTPEKTAKKTPEKTPEKTAKKTAEKTAKKTAKKTAEKTAEKTRSS